MAKDVSAPPIHVPPPVAPPAPASPGGSTLPPASRRPWLVFLFWVALIVGGGTALYFGITKPGDIELHSKAGRRLLNGEAIYRNESPAWPYPPFLAILTTPLPSVSPDALRFGWSVFNVALLVVSLLMVRSMFADLAMSPATRRVSGLLAIAAASLFLVTPIDSPGHDLLILAITVVGINAWRMGEPIQAGFWFGVGAACKATPLLFALMLVMQRKWTALAVMLMTTVGLTLVTDLAFPQKSGELWAASWYRTHLSTLRPDEPADSEGAWIAWNPKNQNLAGAFYRLGTAKPAEQVLPGWVGWEQSPILVRASILGSQGIVGLLLVWIAWPRPANAQMLSRIAMAAAFACGMVLLSPMSSKSHFAVLVLPCSVLSVRLVLGKASALGWLALFAIAGLGWMTSRDAFGDQFSDLAQAYGCVTGAALIGLIAMIPAVRDPGSSEESAAYSRRT